MVGLPATGELSYNGYVFGGATQINVAVEYIYDDANRTIVSHRHIITVRAVIAEDDGLPTDATLQSIRRRLGEPGRVLIFVQKGFGNDLIVNRGQLVDVEDGPKPQFLTWEPIGDNRAVEITWQVTTTVPICEGTVATRGVMALNYSIDYRIDRFGDTTRTLAGYLQIVSHHIGNVPSDTADAYRNAFAPLPIAGFQREQTWSIDYDKSRCNFSIVDVQIPSENPYPANMVDIAGSHRVTWSRGTGRMKKNTISCRISPEAGLNGSQAWNVFLTILTQRLSWSDRRSDHVFLDSLEAEEGLFSRSHNFSATYRSLGYLRDFVGDSGLWRSLGTNWNRWAVSLRTTQFDNRGNAELRDLATDGVVVNLCNSLSVARVIPNNIREIRYQQPRSGSFRNKKPPAEQSWLKYRHEVHSYRDTPTARQSILQSPGDDGDFWPAGGVPNDRFSFGTDTGAEPDVVQEGGAPRHGVRIMGMGERAGHQIGRPAVETVSGVTAYENWFRGIQWVVGNFFGVPVYRALWAADYTIPEAPGTITPLNDVRTGVNGRSNRAAQPAGRAP